MGRTVILNEQVNTARDIEDAARNDSDKTPFAQKVTRRLPTQRRSSTSWGVAAVLVMTSVSEIQGSPGQTRHLTGAQYTTVARTLDSARTAADREFLPPSQGSNDKAEQVAQATTSDTATPLPASDREHPGSETLSCELTNARRDIELLQQLGQEHDQAERLERDLAAARRDVEVQTALLARAVEEITRVKQAAQSDAAELQNSLRQDRERMKRLEQDLAATRRDLETQTALMAKAGDKSSQLKQFAESEVAELRRSMQKERDRADALANDLSLARSEIYAHEARAGKVSDEVAELREQANASPALRKSAQQARDRAERLEQDLAAARRDLETQAALAAKASEEAARMRQTAERDSTALRGSLEQERARAQRFERDLALAQGAEPKVVTIGSVARDKSVEEGANPIAASGAPGDAQPNSEEAAAAAGLVARASALLRQGDIGAARIVLERAVEMGSAQASFSLAETYDPSILGKWGTFGTRGDAIKAQTLYAKADAAGIQEAKARFEALRR